jgi:hypothetical protein
MVRELPSTLKRMAEAIAGRYVPRIKGSVVGRNGVIDVLVVRPFDGCAHLDF